MQPERELDHSLTEALDRLLFTDATYEGGLSNHGPMAAEALAHLGAPASISPYVDHVLLKLEPARSDPAAAPDEWRPWLRARLGALVGAAASQAGHGLLRVAHAVRGLERAEADDADLTTFLRELGAAVAYWEGGATALPAPSALVGSLGVGEWLDSLERLDPGRRSHGMLTLTLTDAARLPGFVDRVAALAPSSDPTATLDALGAAAAECFRRNIGSSAFATLHGTTVSAMATVLLDHLDDAGKQRLVAAVAGFVAAAVVGFDDALDIVAQDPTPAPPRLAELAAASLEDHTIKFTDACISIAARSGDQRPLDAAFRQISRPYGQA